MTASGERCPRHDPVISRSRIRKTIISFFSKSSKTKIPIPIFQYNYDNYLQKDPVLFDFDSLEIYRQAQQFLNNFFLYMFTIAFRDIRKKLLNNFSAYNCSIACVLALPAPHDGRIQKLNLIFCLQCL